MKKLYTTLLLLGFLFISASIYAQPPGFPDDVDDEDAPAAPITGLLSIGIAAGACLGIKKLK
ncbi:hypothetical protein [Mesonia sp.]|uniref:hypothetical protein n=1 Tax=Mesonia sp. TaxID=1960830 RepID=UPI001759D60C|nr:hypothetical protein [Mesonia sp.]HIB37113.1 hypothetical protein [Mesonia sp.]